MIAAILLCLIVLGQCMIQNVPVKNLAGPPSEFELHRTPDPTTVETVARSASVNLWFTNSENGLLSSTTFPQDGVDEFVLSFASPIANSTRVELLREDAPVPPEQVTIVEGKYEVGEGDDYLEITTYIVVGPKRSTYYTFNVYKKEGFSIKEEIELNRLVDSVEPDAVLTFVNNDGVEIHTHMHSYKIKVGTPIGLSSFVVTDGTKGETPINIEHANMEVHSPDGQITNIEMKDDGRSLHDHVFGASFIAAYPGDYILQATVDGTLAENVPFQRSTQHIVTVSSATLEVAGTASMRVIDNKRVGINIDLIDSEHQPKIRAYAEVYGRDKNGEIAPACWVGGIVYPKDGSIELVLDLNWLARSELTGPLTLANIAINDVNTNFVVADYHKEIEVKGSTIKKFNFKVETDITDEMRNGVNPLPPKRKIPHGRDFPKNRTTVPNLLMLPGYCTASNPFQGSSSFENALFPVKKGNFANDEYALIMNGFAVAAGMESYGIIGHSQGGLVGAHLLNYYWTPLSRANKNGRLVQSVASPFQGSTAAGSSANLGKIFGIGCGSNTDLSIDGARNWLQGITTNTRQNVYFYSVTYEQGKFFGDWCSLPMNLILQWPNDGITELKYAPLPGANNMGNVEKWCHSVDMSYPPACSDERRNKEMNSLAAR